MPAAAQAPRETSAGIAHAHPKGDQPATVASSAKLSRSSLTSVLTIVLIRFPAMAIATPTEQSQRTQDHEICGRRERKRRRLSPPGTARSRSRTPSGTAISAASRQGHGACPRDQQTQPRPGLLPPQVH